MDVAIQRPMTVAEFLHWEERQELRYEFDGERPVAMNGGTFAHEIIGQALRAALWNALRGKPGHVLGPSMKIEGAGRIRYPDAFVSLSSVASSATVMPDPVVVFEVISPGSARTDRFSKLREYQAMPSVQQYVILEQDVHAATVFTRLMRGGAISWDTRVLLRGETLTIPALDIDLPLATFYVGVDVPDPEPDPDAAEQ